MASRMAPLQNLRACFTTAAAKLACGKPLSSIACRMGCKLVQLVVSHTIHTTLTTRVETVHEQLLPTSMMQH